MSDPSLNYYVAHGTNAQRLAFTPSPATPVAGPSQGYFFFETDTGAVASWTGAAWVVINAGSGGPATTVAALDGTSVVGVSLLFARADHKHADANRPTDDQKAALLGSHGTPNLTNPYVTNDDPRVVSPGTVTNVSGTTNRITVTSPTTTPVIDISASYVGQASITTLGTITTGVWNGTDIAFANFVQASSASVLVGRRSGSVGDFEQLTLGSGLSISGTVLSATGSGGTVTSVASADGSITVTNPTTTVDLSVVSSPILTTGRTISITGDLTYTSPSFDGSGNVTAAGTLATVNGNVGSFGSSTSIPSFTVNGKGLITAASGNVVIAPAGTLSGTTLNATIVTSSLTSVGTITTGTWNGTRIAFANFVAASAANVLIGRGSAGGAGDFQEITLGSGISFTGTVLSAAGSGANTALSNLASVAINTTLLPGVTSSIDLGSTSFTWRTAYIGKDNIGATSTDGVVIRNNTAAAVGAQQWSPRIHFIAQGWKTTATAASQTIDWIEEVVPIQSTTNPVSYLQWSNQVNAAGYTSVMRLNPEAATLEVGGTAAQINSVSPSTGGSGQIFLATPDTSHNPGLFMGFSATRQGSFYYGISDNSINIYNTNSTGPINFWTNNTAIRWFITSSGNLLAGTDGAVNIGAANATRPDQVFIKTGVTVPLITGGSATNQSLTLRSTSGVGAAGADIIFQVGNNGAVEAGRFLNSGYLSLLNTISLLGTGGAPTAGSAVLVGGTVTVSSTSVTSTCKIFLQPKTSGGTIGSLTYTQINGTSFTINSTNVLDTSTINWWIVEVH